MGPRSTRSRWSACTVRGVVWRVECAPGGTIGAEQLARCRPVMRPGDIVLLDSGWADRFGSPEYDDNPALGVDAATWLVAQGAKLVGVDFATPDLAVPRRPAGFDWPVHHVLLGHGVLIAEHLTNLRPLAGRRIEAMFLALSIEGSDGAPARVIARAVVRRLTPERAHPLTCEARSWSPRSSCSWASRAPRRPGRLRRGSRPRSQSAGGSLATAHPALAEKRELRAPWTRVARPLREIVAGVGMGSLPPGPP